MIRGAQVGPITLNCSSQQVTRAQGTATDPARNSAPAQLEEDLVGEEGLHDAGGGLPLLHLLRRLEVVEQQGGVDGAALAVRPHQQVEHLHSARSKRDAQTHTLSRCSTHTQSIQCRITSNYWLLQQLLPMPTASSCCAPGTPYPAALPPYR